MEKGTMGGISEDALLQAAVDRGLLSGQKLDEIRRRVGPVTSGSEWQVLPLLLQSGELTLEQVREITASLSGKDAGPVTAPPKEAAPFSSERYQVESLLGSGTMGDVYKAWDATLQRHVALKRLKSAGSPHQPRFLREAQAQARVGHENICKIYDIGESGGQWYISMQYIPGGTLKEVAGELGLEEKVRLVAQVAEALHAAHRLGLVHRDVKPANILVEPVEGGRYKPYIADFGLVRDLQSAGATATEDMIGTPLYMAPEQARGKWGQVDRRADVYSLGVMLYELLSGETPFAAESPAEVLVNILQRDPLPLRQKNRAIPLDIETIVMKCLEKEPGNRYGSARELAEDLDRFLDGEPIQARPYSLVQRWAKKIRRHKTVSIVSAVALLAVLLFFGLWLQGQLRRRAEAEAASRFGQDVKEMESVMRYAYLLPAHDIRPERRQVQDKIAEIEKTMKKLGRLAQGPGHYALGQGYLALRDYPQAREHLEQAWKRGFQTPEAAYALGLTLGELFQIELRKSERIADKDLRKEIEKQLEGNYVEPALRILAMAKNARNIPAGFVELLIGYYQKEYPTSLKKIPVLDPISGKFYETKLLEANILQAMGQELFLQGKAGDSYAVYEKSLAAYQEAAQIGRSDPNIYVRCSELFEKMAECQRLTQDIKTKELLDDGIEYCLRAIAIDADHPTAYTTKSIIHDIQTQIAGLKGQDALPFLNQGLSAANNAISLLPHDDFSHYIAGRILQKKYNWGKGTRESDRITLQEAIDRFKKALSINPNNFMARMELSQTLLLQANDQFYRAEDPAKAVDSAIQTYSPMLTEFPNFARGYVTLGGAWFNKFFFRYCIGQENWTAIDKALSCYQKAIKINPEIANYHFIFGLVLSRHAQFLAEFGKDPSQSLAESLRMNQRALQINPNHSYVLGNLGYVYCEMAYQQLLHGQDPSETLQEADSWLKKAQASPSYNSEMFHPLLLSEYIRAKQACWKNQSPTAFTSKARNIFKKGLSIDSESIDLFYDYINILLLQGKFQADNGLSPKDAIDKAKGALKDAMAVKSDYFRTHRQIGELSTLEARQAMRKGGSSEPFFKKAEKELIMSLQINPHSAKTYYAKAELYYWKAIWERTQKEKASLALESGLDAIDQSLKSNPDNGEAYILKSLLLQLRSIMSSTRALAKENLDASKKLMMKAISINSFLKLSKSLNHWQTSLPPPQATS